MFDKIDPYLLNLALPPGLRPSTSRNGRPPKKENFNERHERKLFLKRKRKKKLQRKARKINAR